MMAQGDPAAGELNTLRTKMIDQIEIMSSDILINTQDSINNIENMKIKLHDDN